MEAAGCLPLDLGGSDLALSLTPDGEIHRDEHGEIEVTLCDFQLVRMLYCPWPPPVGPPTTDV